MSCNIDYAAHRRGGCVSALGGDCSCVCTQKDQFKSSVTYVHYTFYGPFVLQTGVNDEFPGVKVSKSPSGNQIKLEMGCVLSSSGANTVETTDR